MAAGDPGTLKRNYSAIAVETELSASIAASTQGGTTTGFIVVSNSGFPSTFPFSLIVDPDTSKEEVVTVTTGTGTTYTVTRGQDNTQAVAHSAGTVIRHGISAREFKEFQTHISARGYDVDSSILANVDTHVHGIATGEGVVVGTLKSQTLTNKTISGAANTVTNIGTTSLVDSAITTAKIADSAITTEKIAAGAVATIDIADAAITSAKIADLTIATGDIADSAITSAKIADGTIVNADINASAAIAYSKLNLASSITSNDIVDATIVDADISATAAIAKTKLNLGGTITSADLVDGTIVNADINASAGIALSKLATDPLARANHTGTQAASTISDFDTQVRTSRLDQMAAPTSAVALNAQKITGLADPSSAQDAVTLNYITNQKGVANGIAELDGNGLVPTHHLPALAISETSVVVSQSAMLALSAQVGDVAVRTDVNKSFILTATPASTLANWQELLTPTDSVLSVDGSTGAISLSGTYLNKTTGVLAGNLDAGAFKVTNLGTPTSNADAATKAYVDAVAGSATAAASSATAAEAAYDSFDDRYLGAKSSAPTLDNDGNSLIEGALYWNSVSKAMLSWDGTAWASISSTADIYRYRYTASGGETSESGLDDNGLTLSYIPGKEQVYLNGVLLARTSDYNATNGTSITGLAALAAGDILDIITFTSFDLANVLSPTLFDAKGDILAATGADTAGKLTLGTNGYVLTADSTTATGLKWAEVDLQSSTIMSIMGAY